MKTRRSLLGAAAAAPVVAVLAGNASADVPPDITQGGQMFQFTSPTDGARFKIWVRVDFIQPTPKPTV